MEEKKGNERNSSRLREAVDDVTEAIADVWHRKRYRDIISFDEILQYAYEEQKMISLLLFRLCWLGTINQFLLMEKKQRAG